MKIPKPKQIRDAFRGYRDIRRGGGPKRVRLNSVGRPEGFFLPISVLDVSVTTESGKTVRFNQPIPVPWPYAWGYRVARGLGLPLASTLEPGDVSFELPVPRWAWPGR